MKFKALIIPALALGMSVIGCNKQPAKPNWSKELQKEMKEVFGFVLPWFETPKESYIYFDDDDVFTVYFTDDDLDVLKDYALKVADAFDKAGFDGDYDLEHLQGQYAASAADREVYGETFARAVNTNFSVTDYTDDDSDSEFTLCAYNVYETKVSATFPTAIVASATGEENPEYLEDTEYAYTIYDGGYVDVYCPNNTSIDLGNFAEHLENEFWYVIYYDEEGIMTALPWLENYSIYAEVITEDEFEIVSLEYCDYQDADIYDAFPEDVVIDYYAEVASYYYETELPVGFSIPAIPADKIVSNNGYKPYIDFYGDFAIDVIDLNPTNESLKLLNYYAQILLDAEFFYDSDEGCYSKVIEED